MVYGVYGIYVVGLEDGWRIFECMVKSFVIPQKSKSPIQCGQSSGDRVERFTITNLNYIIFVSGNRNSKAALRKSTTP
jgi:hypothetical protein